MTVEALQQPVTETRMQDEQGRWITSPGGGDADLLEQLERVLGEAALRHLGIYRLPPGFKLSVAIPVFNEEKTLREIVRRVRAVPIPKEIVIVDDYSQRDRTREILREMEAENPGDLRVFYHDRNQGKGAALRTAFANVSGNAVVVQDADLEYDPAEYTRLLRPIIDGRADVVYGSRFIGEVARVHLFWHRIANGVLTFLSNCFTNLNLTDMETCYKVMRREVLEQVTVRENRFGIEPEITAKIARTRIDGRRVRIYEVPISYSGRDYAEGKHIGLRDGFRALYCIVRYWKLN